MRRLLLLLLGALACVAPAAGSSGASPEAAPDILVYYFHNTIRCATCLTMESEAESVVFDDFADAVTGGLVAWRTVNLEIPGNEHFAARYSLDGPSLVIAEHVEGDEIRWKNLDRIWELVDSPVAYREYVRDELDAYLTGAAPAAPPAATE